ncbi:DUF262 domain-containing protein [bacterium]|nr:DUF262 domain-containing protein [bacterium]
MKKTVSRWWTIAELRNDWELIDFPEFQREPTVWSLEKKQRLIDSIIRDFDIASIYLFRKEAIKKEDNEEVYLYDCIDGRQRLNAIASYLGINKGENLHNGFSLIMKNEIFEEDLSQYVEVDNHKFSELPPNWQEKLLNYQLNVVEIGDITNREELNLLFLRLQLGDILNAGERLKAMTGNMRDYIFKDMGTNPFFTALDIPYRRFAREQVAAQIALNYFSLKKNGEFHRSRYLDLQEFFKETSRLGEQDLRLTVEIKQILDKIYQHLGDRLNFITNRAIAVSLFFFTSFLMEQGRENEIDEFAEFLLKLIQTLQWQLPKRVDMDEPYHYLLDFQTYVTQAAGEKYAIENRHDFLIENFDYFKAEHCIRGDKEYEIATGKSADSERPQ